VAIHQPNFFPWLGYFQKIAKADAFLFLDASEFSSGSWINRVRIAVQGKPQWITCPRLHPGVPSAINQIQIDDRQPWRKKLSRTLQQSYARAACSSEVLPWILELIAEGPSTLAAFNVQAIAEIRRRLEIKTECFLQSELAIRKDLRGSEMLAELVRTLEGTVYLAGDGADDYEDLAPYQRLKIEHQRLGFSPPGYSRSGQAPLPGLSILDALFHLGVPGTRTLLMGAT
jgi:hypothetical protein